MDFNQLWAVNIFRTRAECASEKRLEALSFVHQEMHCLELAGAAAL